MCPMNRTSSRELLVTLRRGDGLLHAQVEGQLRDGVRSGRLAAGERLPSSRALAAELGVSRGVVVEAYGQLAAEGYLVIARGAAPRVAPGAAEAAAPPAERPAAPLRYDLRPGTPDLALFPRAAWAAAQRRALREVADAELGYPPPGGHPRLRVALAGYLGRVRGVQAAPERIVVCGGVAEAVAMVGRVLRAGGAGRIAIEDPSHPGTRELIAHSGVEIVPVAVDDGGIDVAAVVASGADAVLVTPAHQSATGVVLEPARRAALAAWARDTGALVIEDDYDAEYRYDRHPVGALQGLAPDHVVHVHSVSKTLAPALRLGWAAVPARLIAAVVDEKRLSDLGSPVLEQLTLAAFLERGELDRHLRRTRPIYRRRRDALLTALTGLEVEGVAAGLHVLARLPPGLSEAAAVAAAAARGVAVNELAPHVAGTPRAPSLLLGYTRLPEPALAEAGRRLRAALS
jgi:GntR family transcriptional regulator / MocR family aminotransferase